MFVVTSCKKDKPSSPPSPAKSIDSLNLLKGDGTPFKPGDVGVNLLSGDSIVISVPPLTDLTDLAPIISSEGKTISPASGKPQNFSSPVVYTITAQDGSQVKYTVIVIARPAVLVGGSNNTFYALDAAKGSLIWSYAANGSLASSKPAYSNGVVYETSIDHNLYAFNASTGTLKWKFAATSSIESSPAVANGLVYFGSDDHTFYAVDTATGLQKWSYTAGSNISSSPAVVNGIVYFGSDDSYVNALDAATGTVKWRFPTTAAINLSSPAVVNGIVYIGCRDSYLYAIDAVAGTLKWKYYANGISLEMSNPVVSNGIVFIGGWHDVSNFSLAGGLYAVDANTGSLKWQGLNAAGISSNPAVYGNLVFAAAEDGNLFAANTLTGLAAWTRTILANGSSPANYGETLYIDDGGNQTFRALDGLTGNPIWAFPMPGLNASTPLIVGGN
jgi:outer membrane protein assembly factor BamB